MKKPQLFKVDIYLQIQQHHKRIKELKVVLKEKLYGHKKKVAVGVGVCSFDEPCQQYKHVKSANHVNSENHVNSVNHVKNVSPGNSVHIV